MEEFDRAIAADPNIGMGLSPGILEDVEAIREGGNPMAARAGVSTSGSASPRRGFTPMPGAMNADRFDRIAAADDALDQRRAAAPRARSGFDSLQGDTGVISGSVFGSAIRSDLPNVMDDFRDFRGYVDDFKEANDGREPTLDELPGNAQNLYDRYASGAWRDQGAVTEPIQVRGEGAEPTAAGVAAAAGGVQGKRPSFAEASARRKERKELARQRQFSRAQLPYNQRRGAAFNEDGSLDRSETIANLAQAGMISPAALAASGQVAQQNMAQQQMTAEMLAQQAQLGTEQRRVDELIAAGEFERSPEFFERQLQLQGLDPSNQLGPQQAAKSALKFGDQPDQAQEMTVQALVNSVSDLPAEEQREHFSEAGMGPGWARQHYIELMENHPNWLDERTPGQQAKFDDAINSVKAILEAYDAQVPNVGQSRPSMRQMPWWLGLPGLANYGYNRLAHPEMFPREESVKSTESTESPRDNRRHRQ